MLDADTETLIDPIDPPAPDDEVVEDLAPAELPDGEEVEAAPDSGEVVVTIGDEPAEDDDIPPEQQTPVIREIRKQYKDLARHQRELERENKALKAAMAAPAQTPAVLSARPVLADFSYDEDKHAEALDKWYADKAEADNRQRQAQEQANKQKQAWQATQASYATEAAEFAKKVPSYPEYDSAVRSVLSEAQQGLILHAIKQRAPLVAALGANPKKLKELSGITDPILFTAAVAVLETQLKVAPRKAAPIPERTIRGSAAISGTVDNKLERLRAEADRTGDRTQVVRYMNEQKAKRG